MFGAKKIFAVRNDKNGIFLESYSSFALSNVPSNNLDADDSSISIYGSLCWVKKSSLRKELPFSTFLLIAAHNISVVAVIFLFEYG